MAPRSMKTSLRGHMEHESPIPDPQEPSTSAHIEEVLEEDTPDNQTNNQTDSSAPNLAEAIVLMTNKLHRRDAPPKPVNTSVKQPDTFDGSDPKKLNNFILLCNLYFQNNPTYSDDGAKVTFALTLLWGIALELFEPMLMSKEDLAWENDWKNFLRMLRSQFGPIDPTADAADSINNLRMKDNQHILKYNIDFTRLQPAGTTLFSNTATIVVWPSVSKTLWGSKGSQTPLTRWKS